MVGEVPPQRVGGSAAENATLPPTGPTAGARVGFASAGAGAGGPVSKASGASVVVATGEKVLTRGASASSSATSASGIARSTTGGANENDDMKAKAAQKLQEDVRKTLGVKNNEAAKAAAERDANAMASGKMSSARMAATMKSLNRSQSGSTRMASPSPTKASELRASVSRSKLGKSSSLV